MLQRIRSARQEGFTLIELLIVIVVLGILAAIVVFAVGTATSDSKVSACKADKKTLSVAVEAYKATTGAYPAAVQTAASNGLLVPGYVKTWPGSADGTTTTFSVAASTGAISVGGTTTC
jgi:general secretion pathway protein G